MDTIHKTRSPRIRYTYTVNGQTYENERVHAKLSAESCETVLSKYPKGKSVDVYYNPETPAKSLLEPGFSSQRALPGILFLAVIQILLISLGCAVLWLRKQVCQSSFDGELYIVFPRTPLPIFSLHSSPCLLMPRQSGPCAWVRAPSPRTETVASSGV